MTFITSASANDDDDSDAVAYDIRFHKLHPGANFSFFKGIFRSTTAMPLYHTEPIRSNISSLRLEPLPPADLESTEELGSFESEDVYAKRMPDDGLYFVHEDTTFLYVLLVILAYATVLVFLMTKFLYNEFYRTSSSSSSSSRVFLAPGAVTPSRGFDAGFKRDPEDGVRVERVTTSFAGPASASASAQRKCHEGCQSAACGGEGGAGGVLVSGTLPTRVTLRYGGSSQLPEGAWRTPASSARHLSTTSTSAFTAPRSGAALAPTDARTNSPTRRLTATSAAAATSTAAAAASTAASPNIYDV